jgi:hypothetical protein
MTWKKSQLVLEKALNGAIVFGAGSLLDPNVARFVGEHQGVATGLLVALGVLRAAEKAVAGKAAPPAA